jgi:catechol 2,3-dioxygenase-like lactoylglutathione lyase family enzyme
VDVEKTGAFVPPPGRQEHPMTAARTFLAPGQRYAQPGEDARHLDQHVTIARLDHDRFGVPRVTFLVPDGREVTAYAAQIEAAIADGALAPVAIPGALARC